MEDATHVSQNRSKMIPHVLHCISLYNIHEVYVFHTGHNFGINPYNFVTCVKNKIFYTEDQNPTQNGERV